MFFGYFPNLHAYKDRVHMVCVWPSVIAKSISRATKLLWKTLFLQCGWRVFVNVNVCALFDHVYSSVYVI